MMSPVNRMVSLTVRALLTERLLLRFACEIKVATCESMGPLDRRIAPGGKCAYCCECCGAERSTEVHTFVVDGEVGRFCFVARNKGPCRVNNFAPTTVVRSLVEEHQPG